MLQKVAEAAGAAHRAAGVRQGGQIVTVQLDVTDKAQVAALWTKVPQELRNVDILGAPHLLCIHFAPSSLHARSYMCLDRFEIIQTFRSKK
jgi:hypothetical protein